jgi:hypothetical protein
MSAEGPVINLKRARRSPVTLARYLNDAIREGRAPKTFTIGQIHRTLGAKPEVIRAALKLLDVAGVLHTRRAARWRAGTKTWLTLREVIE